MKAILQKNGDILIKGETLAEAFYLKDLGLKENWTDRILIQGDFPDYSPTLTPKGTV